MQTFKYQLVRTMEEAESKVPSPQLGIIAPEMAKGIKSGGK